MINYILSDLDDLRPCESGMYILVLKLGFEYLVLKSVVFEVNLIMESELNEIA